MTDERDDPRPSNAASGAHTDFRDEMSYGGYLRLDQLLDCQSPRSAEHDEMLFLIIHQSTELWLKLVIHELSAAMALIAEGALRPSFKMLARVARIQAQLIQSWDTLSTLTPADYLAFRDALGHASGFQSAQYRTVEFLLGNKQRDRLAPHAHDSETHDALRQTLESPGIYDEVLMLLGRAGFAIDKSVLERDWAEPHRPNESVLAAWHAIYTNTERHWDLYELGEKLVDLEDAFQQWRFRHLTTVERIIGRKRGTGGTAGVGYLQNALATRFFPELWSVRTEL